jgi:small subunit ribosomal protein S15|tara:strand:+ start:238 stop:507 length:270 start_codon:yes stop_codon:yes gene_type:complete
MSITKDKKQELIKTYGKNETDVGSSSSQVAILTERINNITAHLQGNKKDHSARRGLIAMVSTRRSLLTYIQKKENQNYLNLIKDLKIRK